MASDRESRVTKRPGRIRSAFQVLMGRMTTPQQIQADWAEWEIVLTGVLDRFGALLARQAKAEKKRVEQQLELGPEDAPFMAPLTPKAELYAKANQLRQHNAKIRMVGGNGFDVQFPNTISEPEENP